VTHVPERYQGYEQTVTVACVNFMPVAGDKAATLGKIEVAVREAASQGAQIVVFPEEALSGASACDPCRLEGGPCAEHRAFAETVPGPSTERLAALCAELDVHVQVGLPERDPDDPGVLYNAVAFIRPDGIAGTYRKLHLGHEPWVTEGITFTPGDRLPVWETRYGPVGSIICFDFWFNPELTRLLALKGARLVLNSCATYAGPGKRDYLVHTTAVRGQENLCYTASANQVGTPEAMAAQDGIELDRPLPPAFLGHSTIAGPAFPRFHHVYAEAGDGEEIVMATLSFTRLHRWESVFPWRDWRAGRLAGTSALIAREFAALVPEEATAPSS
jgi:predicted amidohydrolase